MFASYILMDSYWWVDVYNYLFAVQPCQGHKGENETCSPPALRFIPSFKKKKKTYCISSPLAGHRQHARLWEDGTSSLWPQGACRPAWRLVEGQEDQSVKGSVCLVLGHHWGVVEVLGVAPWHSQHHREQATSPSPREG